VVVCTVALLFGVAVDRLLRYQEMAERVAVEQNLAAINVALTMKFAALIAKGSGSAMSDEVGANPIDLLVRPPENYLGELYAPVIDTLPPRSWHYDRQSGDLVYVPGSRTRYLSVEGRAPDSLRFRIALGAPATRGERGLRELRQAFMAPLHRYNWSIE
jgi:hypothetical protein